MCASVAVPILAPSASYAPLACLLGGIMATQAADLRAILVLEQHLTAWAELVVGLDARPANVEKPHDVLL
jgi:hypothetical protein